MTREFERMRAELWKDVCAAYGGAFNAVSTERCMNWADRVLEGFDARFADRIKDYVTEEKGETR